jgi:hypothetical protein
MGWVLPPSRGAVLGELADRRAAGAEPFEDGTPGRVGEGRERAVDGCILNH